MEIRRTHTSLMRVGAMALFIALPIVLGVALVALGLAYGNGTQFGTGIAVLGAGLGAEAMRLSSSTRVLAIRAALASSTPAGSRSGMNRATPAGSSSTSQRTSA
jgi:hypothetical protein